MDSISKFMGRRKPADLGYNLEPHADLEGLDLFKVDLRGLDLTGVNLKDARFAFCDLREVNLTHAYLVGATFLNSPLAEANLTSAVMDGIDLTGANLIEAILDDASLDSADLSGAVLHGAKLRGADLRDADLCGADLEDADLTGAKLRGANLLGAVLDGADLTGAKLEGATLPPPPRRVRSYGAMTGPILKMSKPDSPARAVEFKKRYPAEFERLKADTSGRDFTDNLKAALRSKYASPSEWVVTSAMYRSIDQRLSDKPNRVLLFNIDTDSDEYTEAQRRLLKKLSKAVAEEYPKHPSAPLPLLTVGWIRYAQNDLLGVMLIEEVQSDVQFLRTKEKGTSREVKQLHAANIHVEDHAEVIELLRPYSSRFYEDAIGLVFQDAEALGYTVEMLGFTDKKRGTPRHVYTDLPKRMGMAGKRYSKMPTMRELQDKVSFYKPNPSKPSRRHR